MYCANCKTDVAVVAGYCSRCGKTVGSRTCANGHIMDPAWTECPYCTGRPAPGAAGSGQKGRTVVENPGGGGRGGFVKGATLLENLGPGVGLGGAGLGGVAAGGVASGKGKTVFDPGPAAGRPAASAGASLSKLTGWLVSFTLTPSGDDFRLREGRNTVGADPSSDIVIADPSVSGKHAVIICRDGHVQIRDNDSQNGTYVNSEDTFGKGAVSLTNLDTVRFGRVECRLYTLTTASSER